MTTKTQEILEQAVNKHGSIQSIMNLTKLQKTTLYNIRNGKTKKHHNKTIGLLMWAANTNPL